MYSNNYIIKVEFDFYERLFEPRGEKLTVTGTFEVNAENEKHALTELTCETGHVYLQPFFDRYNDKYSCFEVDWEKALITKKNG